MFDAEQAHEFALEVLERTQARGVFVQVAQSAPEQIVEFADGVLGLGDEFDEFDEIRRERDARVVVAEAIVRLGESDFAQRVQLARAAARVVDFTFKKKVESAGKAALRLARAFRDGLKFAMHGGQPREDEARVGEPGLAQQNGGRRLHRSAQSRRESPNARLQKAFAVARAAGYPSRPISQKKTMPEETQPQLAVDASNLRSSYANVCRIAQTPNEVIIDFGMNPNFFGQILDEPLKLDNRVIMSHDAAKRLCLHLTATIQNFEARYGTIELDVTKRLKNQPAS